MSIHLVGVTPAASVKLAGIVRFRGTRWVRGEVDGAEPVDGTRFAGARVDCQLGAAPKSGNVCLDCPRLLAWREGLDPGQVSVLCAWGHFDPVSERMTTARALVFVAPETTCAEALRIAHEESVHRLLVLDDGRLAGVVSRRDLLGGRAEDLVEQVMSREVFVIDAGAVLGEAASAFTALNIGCLPVVREDRLVGIITRGDLRRAGLKAEWPG